MIVSPACGALFFMEIAIQYLIAEIDQALDDFRPVHLFRSFETSDLVGFLACVVAEKDCAIVDAVLRC